MYNKILIFFLATTFLLRAEAQNENPSDSNQKEACSALSEVESCEAVLGCVWDEGTQRCQTKWQRIGLDVDIPRDSLVIAGGVLAAILGREYLEPFIRLDGSSLFGEVLKHLGSFFMAGAGGLNHRLIELFPNIGPSFFTMLIAPLTEEFTMRWLLQQMVFRSIPKRILSAKGLKSDVKKVDKPFTRAIRIATVASTFAYGHDFENGFFIRHNYFKHLWLGTALSLQMEYTQSLLTSVVTHGIYNFYVSKRFM